MKPATRFNRQNSEPTAQAERDKDKDQKDKQVDEAKDRSPEDEPAVDRGERIATGKQIARGGKSSGFVPGADPNTKSK